MATKARIVSAVPLGRDQLDQLGEWEVAVVDFARTPRSELEVALAAAEGLLVNSHAPVPDWMVECAPELRVISTIGVGFDHIAVATTTARGISVTNAPVLSDAVADLTLGLMIMVARRLGMAVGDMSRGVWNSGLLGIDLRAKSLLIVGFGRIGREVASRAAAFKMNICAFDARADAPGMAGVERVATLAEGLARADIVSLHVDLNPSTYHLLDDDAFARMKPSAIVVNTSRGGVIDQAALTRALADGRIAGAGLDVLEIEPPVADEPLLSMPNVVVLPHIGSATTETRDAMRDCAIDNLVACMRGETCAHVLSF
jgi:glyoxylate reductase